MASIQNRDASETYDADGTTPVPTVKLVESKLSSVGQMYDLNGDGVLDEAEQAMRDLDKTGRGYITNDKVYDLMVEHNKTQKSLFRTKKLVTILAVFVAFLTICNLGTSIAAAYLAKDTTTNDNNELINLETNEAVSTQSTADDFAYERMYNETAEGGSTSTRRLCDKNETDGVYTCETPSFLEIPYREGRRLTKKCKKGETVNLKRTWHDGSETLISLCPTAKASYGRRESRFRNGVTMTISDDEKYYVLKGDEFIQELDDVCDEVQDCRNGLVCMDNMLAITQCKGVCDRLRFGPSRLQPCYDACNFRSCQVSFTEE